MSFEIARDEFFAGDNAGETIAGFGVAGDIIGEVLGVFGVANDDDALSAVVVFENKADGGADNDAFN